MSKKNVVSKKDNRNKKISFLSAILLVVGSSIGAGIFLKNGEILTNVGGSIVLALVSWLVAIIGVIAMGLTLTEIGSASYKNNLGIIGWVKSFCSKFLYKCSKNFMAYIYFPINCFIMPYYVVMTVQDAFGWQTSWWVSGLIAFAIAIWFMFVSGLSSKAGNIQNWVITSVKFFPLVFCILVGVVISVANQAPHTGTVPTPMPNPDWKSDHMLLIRIYPILGIIGSIPSIIFAFDGFYTSAGMQSEMKNPRKTSTAMTIGLVIVSVINVLISVSLLVGTTNGKVNGLDWFNNHGMHWVITVVELLIAIGILGVINGFAIFNPRFYEELIKEDELPSFLSKYKSKLNANRPIVGVCVSSVIVLAVFTTCTLIGAFGYIDTSGYSGTDMFDMGNTVVGHGYDVHKELTTQTGDLNKLYCFVDLMANWTSILIFACIIMATIGCLINRKTNKVKVEKSKTFYSAAIISTIIMGTGTIFIFISTFANLGIVANWKNDIGSTIDHNTYSKANWNADMISAIMTLVSLVLFLVASMVPSAFEISKSNRISKTQ